MLPTSGYRHNEIKVSKSSNLRSSKQIDSDITKIMRKYCKTPYKLEKKSSAIRFTVRTFRLLDDVGFFDDPVIQERFKVLSSKN